MDLLELSRLRLVFAAVVFLAFNLGCRSDPPSTGLQKSASLAVDATAIPLPIKAFCGDCHAVPRPSEFPQDGWFNEVDRGFNFYYESGRSDLKPPPKKDVLAYYRSAAPVELSLPVNDASLSERLRFVKQEVRLAGAAESAPAVAFLSWIHLDDPLLCMCDMRSGQYQELSVADRTSISVQRLVDLRHPCHAEVTDLDGNGRADMVVADLGSFLPEDHDRGRVLWLPDGDTTNPSRTIELATGLGRVADVRPGDFDADGDIDLVVAEFGWQNTGRIVLLTNVSDDKATPKFALSIIDQRHGSIHAPTIDFNRDGKLDFIALIGQEHEKIDLFVNEGENRFRSECIYSAENPSFGSSGIEIVDLDGDGDEDVLYSNGDTLDSFYLKPYHAIHWIENQGSGSWIDHILTNMPGVMRALPSDLDGDGDLDVVAVACVPENLAAKHRGVTLDSLIWLEQTSPGRFDRHVLEREDCEHAALEVADFDHDGDPDLAVGNFTQQPRVPLTIWWNETTPLALDE